MKRVKLIMQILIILCAFTLTFVIAYQTYGWIRLNFYYERIFSRMTVAFIDGQDVEQLRAEMAYANATANLKKAELFASFWKGVSGVTALVCAYIPVHFFAKSEAEQVKEPVKKLENSYINVEETGGVVIFDDRKEVH